MNQTPQRAISLTAWAMLGLLALIWGGSFLSNRAALAEVGVLSVVAFRVGGAALVLWAYILWRGLPVPRGAPWLATCLILGVFNNIVPFGLIVWGQTHIQSGLAGILNATTAIFAAAVAPLFFADERMTANKALGLVIGFAGMAVTIGPSALSHLDLTSLGQLAIVGAALSYTAAGIFARTALKGIRPEVGAAGMLSASALIMVPVALAVEGVPTLQYSAATFAALAYLALLASAFAYILFYRVLTLAGASNVSLVTLMIAPVAVLLGALVYDEALPVTAYGGMVLLTLGMVVIDGRLGRAIFRVKSV